MSRSWYEPIARAALSESQWKSITRWMEQRDARYRASMNRLRLLRDRHNGQRCFILGNGPSLNQTDLSLIRNEICFATNRINLLFDRTEWRPSYYVCVNELVAGQFKHDILNIDCPKFFSWHTRDDVAPRTVPLRDDVTFLRTRHGLRSWFYTDLTEGCWEGSTVTMVCLQLAFHLGFSEVILIGVDHSYQFNGTPHAEQTANNTHDPNHFAANYFANGAKWHLPDLEGSELAYRIADFMFRRSGRRVIDATIGGKLQVFPKADYYQLVGKQDQSKREVA